MTDTAAATDTAADVLTPEQLRKCATAVYLAAEGSVAEDIAKHLLNAAEQIAALRAQVETATELFIRGRDANGALATSAERWRNRAEKAEAQVERMREALRPFAEAAVDHAAHSDDGILTHPLQSPITVGDLRKAAAVMGEKL